MSNETILDGALMGAESNYPNDLSSHELKMLDQEQHANSCRELAISDQISCYNFYCLLKISSQPSV
jgi:hypothetical protein